MATGIGAVRRIKHALRRSLKRFFRPSLLEMMRPPEPRGRPVSYGAARLLSIEPPIFLTGTSYDEYLGIAPAFARRHGNADAGFIVYPTWSIEEPATAARIAERVRRHMQKFNRHRIHYICNTPGEADLLNASGQPAQFLNHKFTVSDAVFRPLEFTPVEFDAIYNARIIAEKRHELAAAIPRLAYVAYVDPHENRRAEFRRLWPAIAGRSASHVLLNPLDDGGLPARLSQAEVNVALNRAATGLVLSEVEGAGYAAMEYMLAGLPVVSTRCRGGRDVFFDPDYCAVVEPEPRAVRDAVAALRARQIPRDYIRQRTLQRIEPERRRFLDLVGELNEALGTPKPTRADAWPFGDVSGVPWDEFVRCLDRLERERAATLEREAGLEPGALAGAQLTAGELRPVVSAIRAKPGGSLLVFGCGNDSPLWEKLNAGGVTAFIEDDPAWAAVTRARLATARICVARYDTKRRQWRQMLRRPAMLAMELPQDIRARRWDTILVDGPAGYDDKQPGRMKSIYEASRLVVPGGKVFLHDAEREVEAAYARHFFSRAHPFVEVTGRALLRGYAT